MSPIDIVIFLGVAVLIFVPKRIRGKSREPQPWDQEPKSRESNQDPQDLNQDREDPFGNRKNHDTPGSLDS